MGREIICGLRGPAAEAYIDRKILHFEGTFNVNI